MRIDCLRRAWASYVMCRGLWESAWSACENACVPLDDSEKKQKPDSFGRNDVCGVGEKALALSFAIIPTQTFRACTPIELKHKVCCSLYAGTHLFGPVEVHTLVEIPANLFESQNKMNRFCAWINPFIFNSLRWRDRQPEREGVIVREREGEGGKDVGREGCRESREA